MEGGIASSEGTDEGDGLCIVGGMCWSDGTLWWRLETDEKKPNCAAHILPWILISARKCWCGHVNTNAKPSPSWTSC